MALVMGSLAAGSIAQDAPNARRPARHRFPLCLRVLDLTEAQRTSIHAILQASWPGLREDVAAVAAAREALRAALDAGPAEACTVGAAALDVEAALQTLREGREELKNQIAAVLTPEQLARFEGCLEAPLSDGGFLDSGPGDANVRGADDDIVR